jgi:hypothetical protein
MPDNQPVRWAGVRCQECGREDDSDDERGWKAYIADVDDGGEEVVVFCPRCAERELGTASTFRGRSRRNT